MDEIFIEVKTTKGRCSNSMYITKNELERSIKSANNFYLYRVYNYNQNENTADLIIIKGKLTELCYNPIVYKASIN